MTMKQTIKTGLSAASIVLVSGMDKAMRLSVYVVLACGTTVIAAAAIMLPRAHAESPVERGHYLVVVAGCNDCHTPGFFFGKPEMAKYLGGSDVGFEIPGLGVFPGRNITPDKETGIGNWTDDQIATALTTGKRPDGRQLAPIMPYASLTHMTKEDLAAMIAFLRSIPAVKNNVAGPFKPGEKASIFTLRVEPPGAMAAEAPK